MGPTLLPPAALGDLTPHAPGCENDAPASNGIGLICPFDCFRERWPEVTTYVCKPKDAQRKWVVVDAEGQTLGRLSTMVAMILMGKHRPDYTPNIDTGDFVVVVNAEKVRLTGKKLENKLYSWHTGYPGGIKDRVARKIIEGRFPERVVEKAIERMIPRGPLGRVQLGNLRVYPGAEHPHEAQSPEKVDIAKMNRKNMRAA